MKQLLLIAFSMFVVGLQVAFAAPTISDVKVTSIAPWGMAIDYTVNGAVAGDADVPLGITATGDGKIYATRNLTGDTRCENGIHRVYWNLAKDGVTATVVNCTVSVVFPTYCVIDLSGGAKEFA